MTSQGSHGLEILTNEQLAAEWTALVNYIDEPDLADELFGFTPGDLYDEAYARGLTTTDLEGLALAQGL